jgi:hypothetical protein
LALAAGFSYLQINSIPFVHLATTLDAELLVRIALTIYYNAWYFGAIMDVALNERVYVIDPHRGSFPWSYAAILPLFVAFALLLFWVSSDPKLLSATLVMFWMVDVALWWNYVRFMKPATDASKTYYREHGLHAKLLQIEYMSKYHVVLGWQIKRFSVMLVILIAFFIASYFDQVRAIGAIYLGFLLPSAAAQNIAEALPHTLFLSYVVFAEATSWYKRLHARFFINALDGLQRRAVLGVDA